MNKTTLKRHLQHFIKSMATGNYQ